MKTYPIHNEQHELHAFEINNTSIRRRTAASIVESISNVVILKKPKLFSWFIDGDVFCVFVLNNKEFTIEEPFGDNSRYLIASNPPGHCSELLTVEAAFNDA